MGGEHNRGIIREEGRVSVRQSEQEYQGTLAGDAVAAVRLKTVAQAVRGMSLLDRLAMVCSRRRCGTAWPGKG